MLIYKSIAITGGQLALRAGSYNHTGFFQRLFSARGRSAVGGVGFLNLTCNSIKCCGRGKMHFIIWEIIARHSIDFVLATFLTAAYARLSCRHIPCWLI